MYLSKRGSPPETKQYKPVSYVTQNLIRKDSPVLRSEIVIHSAKRPGILIPDMSLGYEAASGTDGGGSGPSYELTNVITVNDSLTEIPVESHEAYTTGPYGITVGTNGKLAYAAFLRNDQVVAIDTETDTVVNQMTRPLRLTSQSGAVLGRWGRRL